MNRNWKEVENGDLDFNNSWTQDESGHFDFSSATECKLSLIFKDLSQLNVSWKLGLKFESLACPCGDVLLAEVT